MRTAFVLVVVLAGCATQDKDGPREGPTRVEAIVLDFRRPTPADEGRLLVETTARYYRSEAGRAARGKRYEVVFGQSAPVGELDGLREGDLVEVMVPTHAYMLMKGEGRLEALGIKVLRRK